MFAPNTFHRHGDRETVVRYRQILCSKHCTSKRVAQPEVSPSCPAPRGAFLVHRSPTDRRTKNQLVSWPCFNSNPSPKQNTHFHPVSAAADPAGWAVTTAVHFLSKRVCTPHRRLTDTQTPFPQHRGRELRRTRHSQGYEPVRRTTCFHQVDRSK